MRVLGKRVLVKRDPIATMHGSLHIPEQARQRPQEGVVVAIGECVRSGLAVGDAVLFGRYAGVEVTLDGQDYVVLWETDLMAIFGNVRAKPSP